MVKHSISILVAESDRYFAHGLCIGLKAYCYLRGVSLRLVNSSAIPATEVDIIFLGDSIACPPWLYDLYQQGYIPHVFFIRDQQRGEPMTRPPATNSQCGAGTLYRHQPIQAIEALLDKVVFPQEGERIPAAGKCRCSSLLTFREAEVLRYLAIGMSGNDTAGCLGIKNKTVNSHKRSAMRKLCVKTNQELYRWMELGGSSHLKGQSLI
ncbi:TPA: helix-turn-helix domain-containing protein [Serratia fonticola]|uniref:helix-turn-helix domain-containing protein n=1 Tax=Serratia fonticola TaxID=47917 RepID=UPI0034C662DD